MLKKKTSSVISISMAIFILFTGCRLPELVEHIPLKDELFTEDTVAEELTPLAKAVAHNPDTVGWLRVTGTAIDHPVFQGTDNETYLRINEEGEEDIWGCYFADYYANLQSVDDLVQNTVIYGHAAKPEDANGKKFSQLFRYLSMDFLMENPYLYLTIGEDVLPFEIFGVFYTDVDFYYIYPYPSSKDFDGFMENIKAKNEYIFPNITVTEEDKLLTLSTCSHAYDEEDSGNHRFVVMGRLVDEVGKEVVVEIHEDPVRP